MLAILLLALVAILPFRFGFVGHVLWRLAIAVAVIWVLGFAFAAGAERRGYRRQTASSTMSGKSSVSRR